MNINQNKINKLEGLINRKKQQKIKILEELIPLKRLKNLGSIVNEKRIEELEFKNAIIEEIIERNQSVVNRLKEGRLTASQKSDIRLAKARDVLDPEIPKQLEKGLIELRNTIALSKAKEITKEDEDMLANEFDGGKRRRKRKTNKKRANKKKKYSKKRRLSRRR